MPRKSPLHPVLCQTGQSGGGKVSRRGRLVPRPDGLTHLNSLTRPQFQALAWDWVCQHRKGTGQLASSPPTLSATSLWNRLRPWSNGTWWPCQAQRWYPLLEFSSHFSEIQDCSWKDRGKSRPLTWERKWPRKRLERKVPTPLSRIKKDYLQTQSQPNPGPWAPQALTLSAHWAVLGQRQASSRKVVLCEKRHTTFGGPI